MTKTTKTTDKIRCMTTTRLMRGDQPPHPVGTVLELEPEEYERQASRGVVVSLGEYEEIRAAKEEISNLEDRLRQLKKQARGKGALAAMLGLGK